MSIISPLRKTVTFQSDQEAIDYLYGLKGRKIKLGLDNIRYLVDYLDHPERNFPVLHVAGTNGKGSVSAMLESILRAAGYRTGLFTSPHLVRFEERIRLSGQEISMKEVRAYLELLAPAVEAIGASFFETATAMALAYFRDREVDVAILEVGMGGRLDATNIVYPELAVITEIDFDHEKHLGRTVEEIAAEKAGIVKPGVPTLVGARKQRAQQVVRELCQARNSSYIAAMEGVRVENLQCTQKCSRFDLITPYRRWSQIELALLGAHQVHNAAVAIRAIEELDSSRFEVPLAAVYEGLRKVSWPGRLEVLRRSPFVIADVAHNPQGIHVAVHEMARIFRPRRMITVFGVLEDKNYERMLELISPYIDHVVAVTPKSVRALPAPELAAAAERLGIEATAAPSIAEGVQTAVKMAGSRDLVAVLGSHFIMEDTYRTLGKRLP